MLTTRWLVRIAAVVLTGATVWLLAGLATEERRASYTLVTYLRTTAVVAAVHLGLFLAPNARGRYRWIVAALMVPAALIFAGLAGETVMKVVRGYPLNAVGSAFAIVGTAIYAWQLVTLLRPRAQLQ